eukprot:scaffold65663_cov69-Phaeocystis_antarctica.AAC.1
MCASTSACTDLPPSSRKRRRKLTASGASTARDVDTRSGLLEPLGPASTCSAPPAREADEEGSPTRLSMPSFTASERTTKRRSLPSARCFVLATAALNMPCTSSAV